MKQHTSINGEHESPSTAGMLVIVTRDKRSDSGESRLPWRRESKYDKYRSWEGSIAWSGIERRLRQRSRDSVVEVNHPSHVKKAAQIVIVLPVPS